MVDVFTNTIMHKGSPMDVFAYYNNFILPNRATKQQLIDNWYKEKQDGVIREVNVELANNALLDLL